MSEAVTTTGILVKRAELMTPTVFETIGEIDTVTPGGMSRNKIETSTHNEGTESNVLGILRKADPGFHINYVGSDQTHVRLLEDIANNTKAQWQIAFPSGVKRTGPGYVQAFAFDDAPVDGKQGAQITLVWAGVVVEESGAAVVMSGPQSRTGVVNMPGAANMPWSAGVPDPGGNR